MSQALPGEHYCEKHQGNHAHYAEQNCTVCQLRTLLKLAQNLRPLLLKTQGVVPECVLDFCNRARTALNTMEDK